MRQNISIGEYIAIYTDSNDDAFSFGKVIAIDDLYVVLSNISPQGLSNGLVVMSLDVIWKIERDTKYFKKIRMLMEEKKTVLLSQSFKSNNLLLEILKTAQEKKEIIDVELCNSGHSDSTGIVKSFNETTCVIRQIDDYGEDDGACTIPLDDITSLYLESINLNDIAFLAKNKGTI